jgi:tetratricopeptide (TPR) repeat protein
MHRDRAAFFVVKLSLLFLATLAAATSLLAQEPSGGWVGKRVFTVKQVFTLKRDTGELERTKGSMETFKVEGVNGPWLRIRGPRLQGWALAAEVFPADEAIEYFTNYIRDHPRQPFGYAMRALFWREERKDFDKALTDGNDAIRLAPEQGWLYGQRGNTWYARKDYDKAITDFDSAVKLEPLEAVHYNNRGLACSEKGQIDKAIADYNECIKLDPDYVIAYRNRGDAWHGKQDLDKTIADYTQSIRLDPNYAPAYGNRGNAWEGKNEHDKAIADFNEAVKLDPEFAANYYGRGRNWFHKQDYDKAIVDFDQAIRLSLKDGSIYHCRGFSWFAKKEYDKAIADYNEAIRLDSKLAYPHFGRAAVALIASRDGAERDARAAIERTGWQESQATYAVLIGYFGELRAKRGDAAKRLLDDGARQCDRAAWPFPIVGVLRREIDEPALLALAVDDDKRTDARCFLGLDHLLAGRIDRAREHFRWVKEHGTTSSTEYTIAVAELDRLEAKAKP